MAGFDQAAPKQNGAKPNEKSAFDDDGDLGSEMDVDDAAGGPNVGSIGMMN